MPRDYSGPDTVRLRFGALVPNLEEQLTEQGLQVKDAGAYQLAADAITRLELASLLTTTETRRVQQRLMTMITRAAKKLTPLA